MNFKKNLTVLSATAIISQNVWSVWIKTIDNIYQDKNSITISKNSNVINSKIYDILNLIFEWWKLKADNINNNDDIIDYFAKYANNWLKKCTENKKEQDKIALDTYNVDKDDEYNGDAKKTYSDALNLSEEWYQECINEYNKFK